MKNVYAKVKKYKSSEMHVEFSRIEFIMIGKVDIRVRDGLLAKSKAAQ